MSIARICQHDVDTVEAYESARTAAQRMATRSVGMLVVVDTRRRPIGVVTDRDIALRCAGEGRDPATTPVTEIQTPSPQVVSASTEVEDALTVMRTHGIRRLPVVNALGELAGVVTLDDLVVSAADELWQMSHVIRRSSPAVLATEVPDVD
ncbi:MAG: CBS domain-containing protein [Planctomycetaceae bacterium]|nr:CBS domain-containing protein [Planctomycetaceae bacterium]